MILIMSKVVTLTFTLSAQLFQPLQGFSAALLVTRAGGAARGAAASPAGLETRSI